MNARIRPISLANGNGRAGWSAVAIACIVVPIGARYMEHTCIASSRGPDRTRERMTLSRILLMPQNLTGRVNVSELDMLAQRRRLDLQFRLDFLPDLRGL